MGASIYEAPRLSPNATVTQSQVTGLTSALAAKAVLTGGNNLNGTQTITGSIDVYSGTLTLRDNSDIASITLTGSTGVGVFTGGLGSTSLNGSNIGSGTVPAARLPATVATTDTTQTISGTKSFSGQVNFGGSSTGHGYFDTSGDLNVRTSQTFVIKNSSGSSVYSVSNGGTNIPAGNIDIQAGLLATNQGVRNSSSVATFLFNVSSKPTVIGASSTSETTQIVSLEIATKCQSTLQLKSYTVATLPATPTAGMIVFASNGRKTGEGAGSGTGVVAYGDGTAWRAVDTGTTVAA